MIRFNCFILGVVLLFTSCKSYVKIKTENKIDIASLLEQRYKQLLEYPIDSLAIPRNMNPSTGIVRGVSSKDWTSGFFAGNLWQLYQITGNTAYKKRAKKWNTFLEKEKSNNRTHDMGFKVFCSFGKGLEVNDNPDYKYIIVESAKTLSTRYNKNVNSIRSWDFNKNVWEFPVIIDNMMNLELLFEATKYTNDSTYHKIAVQHANTTLKNHFREDNSSFHVVVYDTISGAVKDKVTHQGFSNQSAWARGQSWAVYGYTMAYRYTKDTAYLKQAEATAKFYINNKNLPKDGIPYWDFNDSSIPNAPRDVSAATVMSSALIELYSITKNKTYSNYSKKVLNTLNTPAYLLSPETKGPFILDHSSGNWPKNDEIDEPIVYADYYYLETVLRIKAL